MQDLHPECVVSRVLSNAKEGGWYVGVGCGADIEQRVCSSLICWSK